MAGTTKVRKARKEHGKSYYTRISVIAALAVIALWAIGTNVGAVNEVFLPTPQSTFAALVELVQEGYKGITLGEHIAASMKRLFIALGIVIVVGVPLGIAAGSSRTVLAIVSPFIEFYRPLPPLAYYTLIVLWLGIGDESKILLLVLAGFAPLFIGITYSVQNVSQLRIQAAESLGASGPRVFTTIILRECLPAILTNIRSSLGIIYSTVVAAEMVAATKGLGMLVLSASNVLRNDIVFAGIIVMAVIALLLNYLIELLIRKVTPWKKES